MPKKSQANETESVEEVIQNEANETESVEIKCKVLSTIQQGKIKFYPGEDIILPIEQAKYLEKNKIVIFKGDN